MPTPYIGKARLSCKLAACKIDAARKNVVPKCAGCDEATVDVLNLDGVVVFSTTKTETRAESAPSKKAGKDGKAAKGAADSQP